MHYISYFMLNKLIISLFVVEIHTYDTKEYNRVPNLLDFAY